MGFNSEKSEALFKELIARGFDEGLCREIAFSHMNTDYTATRMLGYLYAHQELSEELLVDEMLGILEDRERLKKKHEAQKANEAISRFYNR